MNEGKPHLTLRVTSDRWRTATAGGVVGIMSIAEVQLAGQPDKVAPSVARIVWRRACWAGTLQDYIWRMIAARV